MMKDNDFKLFRGFDDRRTNGQTFAIVESLSRLKTDEQTDICEKFDLSLTILGGKFLHFSDYSDGQFRLIIFII